jgi:phage tail sheath protein FI
MVTIPIPPLEFSSSSKRNPVSSSIPDVPTAIAAFVGYTEKAIDQDKSLEMRPVRIRAFSQYIQYFGGPYKIQKEDLVSVSEPYLGSATPRMKVGKTFFLYEVIRQFYENGGEECYIVSVGDYGHTVHLGGGSPAQSEGLSGGLKQLEYIDRPTLLSIPDAVLLPQEDYYTLVQMGLAHCKKMGNRFFIIDLPERDDVPESWIQTIHTFQHQIGEVNLEYGAAYTPWQYSTRPSTFRTALIKHYTGDKIPRIILQKDNLSHRDTGPQTPPPELITTLKKELSRTPPSGSVLGELVASDKTRGLWKAPSGLPLKGVSGPCLNITTEMQTLLAGVVPINAIRYFRGKGTLLWGFRTLNGSFQDWYYVPAVRLFLCIEKSLKRMMAHVTSLPNNETTWSVIRNQAMDYLEGLWRAGAFVGDKPQLAYFVKIGLGETITTQDVLSGKIRLEAGIAPLRPGEFISLQITQQLESA